MFTLGEACPDAVGFLCSVYQAGGDRVPPFAHDCTDGHLAGRWLHHVVLGSDGQYLPHPMHGADVDPLVTCLVYNRVGQCTVRTGDE